MADKSLINCDITTFISEQNFVVLDGGLATALESLGCSLNSTLWSAEVLIHQPNLIAQIHLDYFLAGADIAITSTYQASTAGLERHGYSPSQAVEIIYKSVDLARKASQDVQRRRPGKLCFVAGSVGPYGAFLADGSEYRGDYHLTEESMKDFHRPRVQALIDAKVDILACETIPSLEEIKALTSLMLEFSAMPYWISFTLKDESHLSDGTRLAEVLEHINSFSQVVAVGINCVPEAIVGKALSVLANLTAKPMLAYPNSGGTYDAITKTWSGTRSQGDLLTDRIEEWYGIGAKILGGCCQTSQSDIRTIRETLNRLSGTNNP